MGPLVFRRFNLLLAVDLADLGVQVHGDPGLPLYLVDQIARHVLAQIVPTDEQIDAKDPRCQEYRGLAC